GSGIDLAGVQKPLGLWQDAGKFFMVDTRKDMFDATSQPPLEQNTRGAILVYDAHNQPPTSDVRQLPPVDQVTSTHANQWLADAVSAAFALSETYDYYRDRHGRLSLDGQGGSIVAAVRVGKAFPNAFWSDEAGRMFFGDAHKFALGLDVVGHEL